MRNIIILIIFMFVISCSFEVREGFRFDSPRFENIDEACEWIYKNIKYKKSNNIHSPRETLDRKHGDCADMSVLLMAIVGYQHGNYSTHFVSLKINNELHAVIQYQFKYYDCTSGKEFKGIKKDQINYRLSHYNTMRCVYK